MNSTGIDPPLKVCRCFESPHENGPAEVHFHSEMQNKKCSGWLHLEEIIKEAASDGREEFFPFLHFTQEEFAQIVTLPSSISTLKKVKHLILYDSYLVRIPPEIGEMTSLETFTPYCSYRLHWFPYEITRCKNLKDSTVSTRALYGNYKFRYAFPQLQPDAESAMQFSEGPSPAIWGTEAATHCSVCNKPLAKGGLYHQWISLRVATDVLPLLVNACSRKCVDSLPAPAASYVPTPHKGGRDLLQPPCF